MDEKERELRKVDAKFFPTFKFWLWYNRWQTNLQVKVAALVASFFVKWVKVVAKFLELESRWSRFRRTVLWLFLWLDLAIRNLPILGLLYAHLRKSGWFGSTAARLLAIIAASLVTVTSVHHFTGQPFELRGIEEVSINIEKGWQTMFFHFYTVNCTVEIEGEDGLRGSAFMCLGRFSQAEVFYRKIPERDVNVRCTFGRRYWILPASRCVMYVDSKEERMKRIKVQGLNYFGDDFTPF